MSTSPISLLMVTRSLLLLFVWMAVSSCCHAQPINTTLSFERIFQFGDSYSDTGNFIHDNVIGVVSPFARLPYGETFFHHATGRCSDGRLIVDFFAEAFHLPYLNPYLVKDSDFSKGVDFAVAGATVLNIFTLGTRMIVTGTASSVEVQLERFRSYLESSSLCSTKDPADCKEKFKKTLFLMGEIGENDYNYALVLRKSTPELYDLVPDVVQGIKKAVEEVIKHGASSVVVPGIYPLGCLPMHLEAYKTDDLSSYDEHDCLKDLNNLSRTHNDQLQRAINDLRKQYPEVKFAYGDYFTALLHVIRDASKLGFDADKRLEVCCGVDDDEYHFNLLEPCGFPLAKVCPDPSKMIHWDGVHMTEQAHRHIANWLLADITLQFNKK